MQRTYETVSLFGIVSDRILTVDAMATGRSTPPDNTGPIEPTDRRPERYDKPKRTPSLNQAGNGARYFHDKVEWGGNWTSLADPEGNEFYVGH